MIGALPVFYYAPQAALFRSYALRFVAFKPVLLARLVCGASTSRRRKEDGTGLVLTVAKLAIAARGGERRPSVPVVRQG
jgi:hypothetical protein